MGCGIHLHIEVKIEGDWHHYNHPDVDRYYKLFAKMAGVRNYEEVVPISSPKGLPSDPTFSTLFDATQWGLDGHSHSYLGAEEVIELYQWIDKEPKVINQGWFHDNFGWLFGNSFGSFLKYSEDYPTELEDFRFVFWFDC